MANQGLRIRKAVKNIIFWIGLIVVLVWCLFPYYWMFVTAFKTPKDYFAFPPVWLPSPWSLENFRVIFLKEVVNVVGIGGIAVDIIPPLLNSIIVALGTTFIAVLVGSLTGFALSRFKFRGRENIAFWIFTIRMLPPIAIIIPYFIIMKTYGLIDTKLGLIITYLTFNLPLAVWLLMRYFEDIPDELEDAALVDGCSRLQAFRIILFPLAMPGIIATALFCIIFSWNEYLFAASLTSVAARTITTGLAEFVTVTGTNWGEMAAVATISLLPAFIFLAFVQRYIVMGLTFGAVKE